MSETRTEAERANDPRTGTHIHPEALMLMHANPDRSIPRGVWIFVAAALLIVAGIAIARAAETPARWDMTLFHLGKDYDLVAATHRVLATYDSREECLVMITRVKVHVSGARLQCNPAETRGVR
jgi:hypothetical protein